MSVDGKDAMHSSYPLRAEVCSTADSWYPLSLIIEDYVCNAHNREEISMAISLALGPGVGRHGKNGKLNNTLAKEELQTTGTRKVHTVLSQSDHSWRQLG